MAQRREYIEQPSAEAGAIEERDMGSIFGGSYEAPEVPATTPLPSTSETQEPVSKSVREEERRRLRARRSMSGTLLTSPLGTSSNTANGLLGRV